MMLFQLVCTLIMIKANGSINSTDKHLCGNYRQDKPHDAGDNIYHALAQKVEELFAINKHKKGDKAQERECRNYNNDMA